jgi:hypothetical protein
MLEFWREDSVGPDARLRAGLHTLRRRVEVSITPTDAGSDVAVKVLCERFSAPGRGPRSIAETVDLYDASESGLAREDALDPTPYDWLPDGRDPGLEQRILDRIRERLSLAPLPAPAPEAPETAPDAE